MESDRVFEKPLESLFCFDAEVASVFDDMLERSVPFYKHSLDLSLQFLDRNLKEEDRVYDLGSSTGTMLLALEKFSPKKLELIGLDSSDAMVEKASQKARAFGSRVRFVKQDILSFKYKNSGAFISNYTLQFVRPQHREGFVKKLYESLREGGVFILSEKLIAHDKKISKQMIDVYHEFKKNQGYSEYEIAQKREALENVLVPFSEEENRDMLKNAGFDSIETLFRWANFASFIAIKK
ncbi:MAG: carboxy-S-adenosyl-L-methionine synthase CmoA [Campylobacterales bacterium]